MAASTESRVRVPSQERAQRTRDALLRAGDREFATRGYAATTAKSIADRAKVATGSFYQYFTSKDTLLRELAARRLSTVASRALALLEVEPPKGAKLEVVAREQLRAVVEIVMDLHREDPAMHAVLTERRHADTELDALWRTAEREIVQRLAALVERWGSAKDPLAQAFVLFGMVEGSVHAHVLGEAMVSDERFVAALVDALSTIARPQRKERS
ncbi:MAG TPA: TetR/AcrR family transcriptional regulator [Nannocystaceae bacterium]|nr:TetR/AcrR family transcriptional regulator [Nannocystaceae bacterium]